MDDRESRNSLVTLCCSYYNKPTLKSPRRQTVFHKWSAMYNKVPPVCAVDSVGVNSKEKFGIFIFFTILVSLSILVSEIAIKISNTALNIF